MANEKRLIDANALIAEYDRVHIGEPGKARKLIEDAPTVDAVEVVHGRWFMRGGIFRCSECDSKALLKLDSNVGGCREYTHFRSNYCPNCGAKMDGDGNGNR